MNDINHVVIIGRLTKDIEVRYLSNGTPVANLSIAVNRSKKEGDQWVEMTSFFNVQLWGNSAENLKQYLVKGKMIAVDGELRQDRWEKDGQQQSKVYICSRNIQLVGGKDGSSNQAKPAKGNFKQNAAAMDMYQESGDGDDFPEDIPF